MARLHLSEECHQSGQLRKCHHSRQVGFHLARTHVILTLPRPPPFFNTTPEKCHRNGHSLTVHLLRYSDTKDLKMPLSTKYRRQLAPSFMGANYMSKSHVTVVGAVAEGKTCQRSSPNLRWASLSKDIPGRYFPSAPRSRQILQEKIPQDTGAHLTRVFNLTLSGKLSFCGSRSRHANQTPLFTVWSYLGSKRPRCDVLVWGERERLETCKFVKQMQRPQNCKRKCERKLCEKQTFSCNGDTLLCGRDLPLPLAKHNLVLSQNFKMNCCFQHLSVSALVTHTSWSWSCQL